MNGDEKVELSSGRFEIPMILTHSVTSGRILSFHAFLYRRIVAHLSALPGRYEFSVFRSIFQHIFITREVLHFPLLEQYYTVHSFDILQLVRGQDSRLLGQVFLYTLVEQVLAHVCVDLKFQVVIDQSHSSDYESNLRVASLTEYLEIKEKLPLLLSLSISAYCYYCGFQKSLSSNFKKIIRKITLSLKLSQRIYTLTIITGCITRCVPILFFIEINLLALLSTFARRAYSLDFQEASKES